MVGIAEQLTLFVNGTFGAVIVATACGVACLLSKLFNGASALHDPIEPQHRID